MCFDIYDPQSWRFVTKRGSAGKLDWCVTYTIKTCPKRKKPIALDGKNLSFHSKLLKDDLKMHFMFNNSHDITVPSAVHRRWHYSKSSQAVLPLTRFRKAKDRNRKRWLDLNNPYTDKNVFGLSRLGPWNNDTFMDLNVYGQSTKSSNLTFLTYE